MTDDDNKLIKAREVCQLLSISRTGFYEGVRDGRFPKPIQFGPRTSRWRKADIIALINEAERKARAA